MSGEIEILGRTGKAAHDDGRPKVGEWFWLMCKHHEFDEEEEAKERLVCVTEVLSNHVVMSRHKDDGWEQSWQVRYSEILSETRPEPNWKACLMKEMESCQAQMADLSRQLIDEAVKRNALAPISRKGPETAADSMLPAIRVIDPVKQKRDLIALQKKIPVIVARMDELAKEYAGLAKSMVMPEHAMLLGMKRDLGCLEDKIFTIEVYAGMQEEVLQIRKGEPAKADERIAIRQSFLFMDEETLIDYNGGGMDFAKLEDFDEWVARPENLARCLPEKRGIVAFRVRRNMKDYGPCQSIAEAFTQARWHAENFKTYLLFRNGDNVYRIASSVEFWPRLIPLRSEFDDAFTKREQGRYDSKKREYGPDQVEQIAPDHLDYDKHANALRKNLIHYNRIVILIQGLLDRSECFHPHVPINLTDHVEFSEWINLIRDDEDVIGTTQGETPKEFLARINSSIEKGTLIYTGYADTKPRGYHSNNRPNVIRVDRRRNGRKSDIQKIQRYSNHGGRPYLEDYEDESDVLGVDGVEVSWPWGQTWKWTTEGCRIGYKRQHLVDSGRRARQWIPLKSVINVDAYQAGDFKQFLNSRHNRAEYLKWIPAMLNAEKVKAGTLKEEQNL